MPSDAPIWSTTPPSEDCVLWAKLHPTYPPEIVKVFTNSEGYRGLFRLCGGVWELLNVYWAAQFGPRIPDAATLARQAHSQNALIADVARLESRVRELEAKLAEREKTP